MAQTMSRLGSWSALGVALFMEFVRESCPILAVVITTKEPKNEEDEANIAVPEVNEIDDEEEKDYARRKYLHLQLVRRKLQLYI